MAADLGLLTPAVRPINAYVRSDVKCTAIRVISPRKNRFPLAFAPQRQQTGSSNRFTCTSRLGSLAPSPLGAWPRLANCCQALCSRITLNGATQPKPDLWSLTWTSLLWLGWPTSTPVLTLSKPLRESVTPSCDLGCRSHVDQRRWLPEIICPVLGPRRLRAPPPALAH